MSEVREDSLQTEWQQIKPSMVLAAKGTALVFCGDVLELLSETNLNRGTYPEPFDVASHIGNFREAGMGTMAAGTMIGMFLIPGAVMSPNKSEEQIVKRARLTAIGAFLASSVVQVAGETFGLTNNILQANTPDMLDAAYGVGWSAFIAAVAYRTGMKYMRRQKMIPTDISTNPSTITD